MSRDTPRESPADARQAIAQGGSSLLEAGCQALSEGRFGDARRCLEAALAGEETPEAHGQPASAAGWGERALRLLAGLTPGPEHVWLAIVTAGVRGRDAEQQRQLAHEATVIARRLARPDLEAMGLASEGRQSGTRAARCSPPVC